MQLVLPEILPNEFPLLSCVIKRLEKRRESKQQTVADLEQNVMGCGTSTPQDEDVVPAAFPSTPPREPSASAADVAMERLARNAAARRLALEETAAASAHRDAIIATGCTSPATPTSRKLAMCLLRCQATHRCSSQFAAMLPVKTETREGLPDCGICMTTTTGSLVVTLPCLHTYHQECAEHWLVNHESTCPECRTKVCPENFSWPPLQLSVNTISVSGPLFPNSDTRNDEDTVMVAAD